jgi:hypothetical protein
MTRSAIAVLATAACILLAGCGGQVNVSSVPPSRYLVCTDVAGPCGVTPRHEPASLLMSGDGSLYAKDITWAGWGTSTAVGRGTAEENNCEPDCAQGSYSGYGVSITLTRPEPWHGDEVYTRAAYSIPSLNQHDDLVTGLPTA